MRQTATTATFYQSRMPHSVPNRGPQLFGVDVFFVVIAPIAVLLRCYVRLFMVKAFGLDDWLMVFSMVSAPEDIMYLQEILQCVVILYLLLFIFHGRCTLWHWSSQIGLGTR